MGVVSAQGVGPDLSDPETERTASVDESRSIPQTTRPAPDSGLISNLPSIFSSNLSSAEDLDRVAEEDAIAKATAAPHPDHVIHSYAGGAKTGCPWCGPVCYGGAAHNARKEDGIFFGSRSGELSAASPAVDHADGYADPELRCRECRMPRHASPRHTVNCRFAFRNCPGCVYADQAHIASCPISAQLRQPNDTCCTGVDLPSIGNVHAPDCKREEPVVRASAAYAPARVETLHPPHGIAPAESCDCGTFKPAHRTDYCYECGSDAVAAEIGHARDCATGRVLGLLAQLCAEEAAATGTSDLKSQLRASHALLDAQEGGVQ